MFEKLVQEYSSVSDRFSVSCNRAVKRWTLMLPGAGCEYWKRTGGCTMCGFSNATQKFTHGRLFPSLAFSSMYFLSEKFAAMEKPHELFVYNGGSFWNDAEIPADFQMKLFKKAAQSPSIQRVMVESRCEYITEEKLAYAKRELSGKKLTVGIGFESQDEHVRNVILKKGLSKNLFERKVSLVRKFGGSVAAYVFLKPFLLSEEQAFAETCKTIEYALSVGVEEINISSAFVQENTLLAREYQKGNFKPPSLWTIIRLIKLIEEMNWPVSIGGFTDEPSPIAAPDSCPACSTQLNEIIERYRKSKVLDALPPCACNN